MTSPIRRIIIVDDHDAIRRGVRQLLETKPYYQVVGEAEDGRAGLELARETKPDIAILDYSIPELNGLDLSHALKREFPRIEILLYTMHDREEIIMDVLRAGVRGFVLKSDTEKHLIAALDALSIHRSYFSGAISDTLLDQFLESKPHARREQPDAPRARGRPAGGRRPDQQGNRPAAEHQRQDRRDAPGQRDAQAQAEDDRGPGPLRGAQPTHPG